jgi:RimJ/RimL family protein N-acetyltransferase
MTETAAASLPMTSRRTRLRPPAPQFIEELFELAATNQIPWSWQGPETPDGFRESFWAGVAVQFAIEDVRNGRSVGLLVAYNMNPFHQFCYISMFLHPDYRLRVWPLEGALLFANYLFTKFNMRNLYAETADPYFDQFRSGIGTFFEVEGRLRDRVVVNGETRDLYILTFKRDRWLEDGVPLLERCTAPARGGSLTAPSALSADLSLTY